MASSSSSSVVDNSRIRNERLRDERRRAIPRTRVVDLLDASRRWHKIRVTEIPPPARVLVARAARAARRSRVKCPRPLSGGVSKIAFAFARRATVRSHRRHNFASSAAQYRRATPCAQASHGTGARVIVRTAPCRSFVFSFFRFFVRSFVRSFVHTGGYSRVARVARRIARIARVARRIARIARVARGVRGVERGGARERRGDLGVVAVRLRVGERVDGGVRGAMRGVEGVALARGGVARCHLRRDGARGVSRARETRETRARNASNANECECEIARVASRRVARTVTKPSSSRAPSSRGAPSRDARAPMRAPRARMRRASVARVVALALLARCARAFSGGAGACAHASVGHGTRATPRAREDVVVRVGRVARGTTVAVEIRARAPFRGFLLRATRAASGEALGAFDARAMPRGTRVKSDCGSNAFATHDGSTDATTSVVVPWMAPDDAFDAVRFEATVVEDYNTWYAVERDVACGQGGDVDADANARLDEAREANASDGARARRASTRRWRGAGARRERTMGWTRARKRRAREDWASRG